MPKSFVSVFRTCVRVSMVAVILAVISTVVMSQTPQNSAKPDRGVSPAGTYALSDIERINMTNGNLNLSIPLAALPPIAGGKLSHSLRANYNSKLWDVKRDERRTDGTEGQVRYVKDVIQQSNSGGWSIGGKYEIRFQQADLYDFGWLGPEIFDIDYTFFTQKPYSEWVKVQLITPDGATHELRPMDYIPYQQSLRDFLWGYYWETPDRVSDSMRYYSSDGSFIWAKLYPTGGNTKWEVYLQDGTHITDKTNFQRIIDPNGNSIKIITEDLGGGVTVDNYEDENTNGTFRSIKHTHTLGSFTETIEYDKFGGTPVTMTIQWAQKTVVGQTYNVKDHAFGTNDVCDRIDRFDANLDVIAEIDLPETEPGIQRKFSFSYNSDPPLIEVPGLFWFTCENPGDHIPVPLSSYGWGSLSKMDLPSGAHVNYTYENNDVHWLLDPSQAPRERLTAKTVDHDNNTLDQWTYSLGPSSYRFGDYADRC